MEQVYLLSIYISIYVPIFMVLFRTFTNEKKSHCRTNCVIVNVLFCCQYLILSVLFAEKVKQHSNTPKLTHYHCQMSKASDWLQDTLLVLE